MMQLSHVLFRTENLHLAVQQLTDAGFKVEYGSAPLKAYNAFIWFEEGVFIEIFRTPEIPMLFRWVMKIFGYTPVLNRINRWNENSGWCDWSLETVKKDLQYYQLLLEYLDIDCKAFKSTRKDVYGRKMSWQLAVPGDTDFPFLMSAYSINPRPDKIIHPNGIRKISKVTVGKKELDTVLLDALLEDRTPLNLVDESKGLQTVAFINSDLKIEDILI
ncbi:VOC family protein [Chryseobacterium vrystaatense]|uniref:Glyoxalase-like domain-containing protein n=1 Tax=Chryseobacterium vrystaatense TaxID=307480 RepID=A0ABR4ULN7_9FLAO|nr:VOC family protein [Chryseobacterium vrystaatense]KFF25842.1 hypothetical protein IW16_13285 [Chryseobacterium vrystaatense]